MFKVIVARRAYVRAFFPTTLVGGACVRAAVLPSACDAAPRKNTAGDSSRPDGVDISYAAYVAIAGGDGGTRAVQPTSGILHVFSPAIIF